MIYIGWVSNSRAWSGTLDEAAEGLAAYRGLLGYRGGVSVRVDHRVFRCKGINPVNEGLHSSWLSRFPGDLLAVLRPGLAEVKVKSSR